MVSFAICGTSTPARSRCMMSASGSRASHSEMNMLASSRELAPSWRGLASMRKMRVIRVSWMSIGGDIVSQRRACWKYGNLALFRAESARMELDAVKIFLDVMRIGSFASVARLHGVDPSSISRTIGLLEEQLGFRLFQRTTRRLVATEPGN